MVEMISKFRKKYTLAILLWASGTAIALITQATLGEYTMFAGTVLTLFGAGDLVDKKVQDK